MPESPKKNPPKWHHPADVMKLHKLKQKKKALQARINGTSSSNNLSKKEDTLEDIISGKKRRNPFIVDKESKRNKTEPSSILEESTDATLFKLLHQNETPTASSSLTSFDNILSKINDNSTPVEVVKAQGKEWLPIDWTLKTKLRLLSEKPFPFNCKLKISEEASGITGFTRCLDSDTETTLDTSPNSRFHQCCLYWQQPSFPWLNLFPRSTSKTNQTSFATNSTIRENLQRSWADSFRSLFQLIRTRQCPYFYACANSFTVLFRAAGICGYADVIGLISPTTRGFRQLLKQEDIEFSMPLKKGRISDHGYETLDSVASNSCEEKYEEAADNEWMKSMGINAEDIKQINYTQAKITHRSECEIDNSEQSLVIIEGVEVHAFYNFLINCKSATSVTGTFAGIPPTLLAPVAFHGATLNSLKVRESKVRVDDYDYYSFDISGPVLPCTLHNLFGSDLLTKQSLTVSCSNVTGTEPFGKVQNSKIRESDAERGTTVFGKENLRDCGMNSKVLKRFCTGENQTVSNVECLKYDGENGTFTWT